MLCPTCGTQNSDDSAFCFRCGQSLNATQPASPQAQVEPIQPVQAVVPSNTESTTPHNPYAPPRQINAQQAAANIPNYLTQAIILTVVSVFLMCLCYCMTVLGAAFGVVAIVYANKVTTYLAVGDLEQASRASSTAKLWCWLSFGVLIVSALLGLLIFGAAMFTTLLQDVHS